MNATVDIAVSNIDPNQLGTILGWTIVLILGSGVLILVFRVTLEGTPKHQRRDAGAVNDTTMIRSWLAIALVSGLLLFASVSFVLDSADLRNLLMGGVIASAGTATAFYFASKSAERTQQTLLNAAFGGVTPTRVPDVKDLTVADARSVIQAAGLTFQTEPATASDSQTVTSISPPAGTSIRPGEKVTAVVAGTAPAGTAPTEVPDVLGQTVANARTTVMNAGLSFATNPEGAADDAVIGSTEPPPTTVVQKGSLVTGTIA